MFPSTDDLADWKQFQSLPPSQWSSPDLIALRQTLGILPKKAADRLLREVSVRYAMIRVRSARIGLSKAHGPSADPEDLLQAIREMMHATIYLQDVLEELGFCITEHVFAYSDRLPESLPVLPQ